jgi:uncharacterized protein DUF5906
MKSSAEIIRLERRRRVTVPEHGVTLDDFRAYMRTHDYIFMPTGERWPAASVNARVEPVTLVDPDGMPLLNNKGKKIKVKASAWLDEHRPVEQMTWAPGQPAVITDRLVTEGGWVDRPGANTFNLYRPPTLERGDASKAGRWRDHLHEIYPDDAAHIECFLAHRVQRPHEKINHGLLMGGVQGIGKDALLEPVKHAVGPWNFREISPKDIFGEHNDFVRSVVLRVNEVHDLGDDISRFAFYDRMKNYCAAPPHVLRVNEKYRPQYYVVNCCGTIMTTNHQYDGLYLPPEDRRTYFAWSDAKRADFPPIYWDRFWHWYEHGGGYGHVAAYLAELDISEWNAKAPPPRTKAWWNVVDAARAPEDSELADLLDKLGQPNAVTIAQLVEATLDSSTRKILPPFSGIRFWLKERKNRRVIPHRMRNCGYVPVRNDTPDDGLWKIGDKRQVVYARNNLLPAQQFQAARRLTDER